LTGAYNFNDQFVYSFYNLYPIINSSEFNYLLVKLLCQADYKQWLAAQIGLPPLEDWMDNMLMECFKKMNEMYRDDWDDNYWDAIIQNESAS